MVHRLLGWLEAATTRRPRAVLAVLLLLTVAFGGLASTNEFEVDLARFGDEDSAAVQAMNRVREDFGDPTAMLQVILDAGPGGDMLSSDGFAAVSAAERVVVDELGEVIRKDADGRHQLVSLRRAVLGGMTQQGLDPVEADDARLGEAASAAVVANPRLAALVSDDLDLDSGSARATVVLVPLDVTLTEAQRTDAGERLRAAFEDDPNPVADVEVTVFSDGLFVTGLLDAIRAEVPLLFGLALLVVLSILWLAYRTVFDVVVAFAGLLAAVVWTFGLVALLGPSFLGWTGPLSQLAVIVPVLLVGLGVDYSVHLTARYREQRATGQSAPAAAGRALHTVGAALVLATVATAIGFGSITTAPLQMLADFGVFVAVGVICAFVVMGLLVPSALTWRDRERPARDGVVVRELGLTRLMNAPVGLARTRPWAGLIAAAAVVAGSLVAATGLDVEFDRDGFIPEGSEVAEVLERQKELFGGGVTEATFVVIDGDLSDPDAGAALDQAQRGMAGIDGVRTVGGQPQVMIEVAPDEAAAVVQIRTTTGDEGAGRLQRAVEDAFAPVVAAGAEVAVTSEPIIIGEMSEELAAFQGRAIALTLVVVLLLLTAYYGLVRRRPMLGVVAMIPATASASLVVGTMWLLGISFNVLTATLTAIAIGIGVPYGVHLVNRFAEHLEDAPAEAVARTLRSTGGALSGSAATTFGAFVVLMFSGLPPIRSLGLLGGAGIAWALLAALLVEPGALVLWARWHDRRSSRSRDRTGRHAIAGPARTGS
jgi:uncharacterized protein